MKVLMVTRGIPYPLNHGSYLRLYHLARELALSHELHLIVLYDGQQNLNLVENIKSIFKSVEICQVPRKSSSALVRGIMMRSARRRFIQKINLTLEKGCFDVVHFHNSDTAYYGLGVENCSVPLVLDCVDCLSLLFKRNQKHTTSGIVQWLKCAYHSCRLARFEKQILSFFCSTVVVSPADADELRNSGVLADIRVIPNGVDTSAFSFDGEVANRAESEKRLVFIGNMDFKPNIHAMIYFVGTILPLVNKMTDDVVLQIVGGNPSSEVLRMGDVDGVEVMGYVPDVRSYLHEATVVVIPMVSGGGIKNKVLEAFSMTKAVVTTPMGIEAIEEVQDNVHALIADTAESFACSVVRLLNDKQRRVRLGGNARFLVEEVYSWKSEAQLFTDLYENVQALSDVN